jgi:putative membrane protein
VRITNITSLFVVVSALALGGCNRESNDPNDSKNKEAPVKPGETTVISEDGREFVMSAARDGMFEVEAGKLAQTKATDESVKKYAGMMVEHHSKANEELTTLAKSFNLEVPTQLPDDKRDKMQELRDEEADDFDEKYIEMMIDAHQDAVDLFEKQMKRNDDDPQLQQWASKTVPTLRTHLEEAKTAKKLLDEKDDLVKDDDLVNPDGTPKAGTMPAADAAAGTPEAAKPTDPTRAPGSAQ